MRFKAQNSSQRRPFLLFTTNRTGSGSIYKLLNTYYHANYGISGLDEFLIYRKDRYTLNSGQILDLKSETQNLNRSESLAQRLKLLKASELKYNLKAFPSVLNDRNLPWFLKNYDFYLLARRNTFNQVLSYIVSRQTNLWRSEDWTGKKIEPFIAKKNQFTPIHDSLLHFHHRIKTTKSLMSLKVHFYEDLFPQPQSVILKHFDLNPKTMMKAPTALPKKDQKPNPSKLILNRDEVQKWYTDSWLPQITEQIQNRQI